MFVKIIKVPSLKLSHVHIKDWIKVEEKIQALISGKQENVQVSCVTNRLPIESLAETCFIFRLLLILISQLQSFMLMGKIFLQLMVTVFYEYRLTSFKQGLL